VHLFSKGSNPTKKIKGGTYLSLIKMGTAQKNHSNQSGAHRKSDAVDRKTTKPYNTGDEKETEKHARRKNLPTQHPILESTKKGEN